MQDDRLRLQLAQLGLRRLDEERLREERVPRAVRHDPERQPVRRYLFYRCWVSEYQALPFLDAGASATAFEHITVQNEGWERDTTLAEPQEQ